MAAAAVMVSSPSSILGGEPSGNEMELPSSSKTAQSVSSSDSIIKVQDDTIKKDPGDVSPRDNEKQQQQVKQESSSQSKTEKPIEFNDSSKKPPRMSSVDDYTMLPEGYVPKDEDVICSWARQNVSSTFSVFFVKICNMLTSESFLTYLIPLFSLCNSILILATKNFES